MSPTRIATAWMAASTPSVVLSLSLFSESQRGADILKGTIRRKIINSTFSSKKALKDIMNPFKGVCGKQCKRKPKSKQVEVKQEPGIKEEPNDGDDVINIPRPRVDEGYRANYEGPVDFDNDFDVLKNEIKCGEEETGKETDLASCERVNESAANDDDNEESMGDAIDGRPSQAVGSGKKLNGSSRQRNARTIPRNRAAKKQNNHKCHVCNHLAGYKSELIIHLRTHTGEKPFQCDVCLKSFTQKIHLNRHKETHGQFRCSKCNRGFEQESVKIDHERLCDPQEFECDICGYHTVVKSNLTVHMRIPRGI